MPLLDLVEQQLQEVVVGVIRLGFKDEKGNPKRGSTLRFTTKSRSIAESVQKTYGGELSWWDAENSTDSGWQVITGLTEIAVTIPPGKMLEQWWELWGGQARKRQCNGLKQTNDQPCVCPADLDERSRRAGGKNPTACKPYTRLNVLLLYVAGIGVWRVNSTGMIAAVSLGGQVKRMEELRGVGITPLAVLRMEQGSSVTANGIKQRWVMPMLDLTDSYADLASGALDGTAGTLRLPPPPPRLALTAGDSAPAPATPRSVLPPPAPPAERQKKPTAQDLADRAVTAKCRDDLLPLIELAKKFLLSDQLVKDPSKGDGAHEELKDLITYLWGILPPQAPATPSDEEPPPPDDDH